MVDRYESSDNERLRVLGLLALRSCKLEDELRGAFCSLVGSKYAAVVAGGQAIAGSSTNATHLLRQILRLRRHRKRH
jgi:hypothetical protein